MKLNPEEIKAFQKKILAWYKKNKRALPWRHPSLTLRTGTRDPYKVLVSEIMSQQTQLSRVVPKYLEWIKAFPDIESLAKASTREVLLHWSGLGYNRRALYLKKCAEKLVTNSANRLQTTALDGSQNVVSAIHWPKTEQELRKLPGIGEYTARAILCFAFNEQVAVVDTNVRKVILTEFHRSNLKYPISNAHPDTAHSDEASRSVVQPGMTSKYIQSIADQLLPKGKAYEWNQALMDYAAAFLRPIRVDLGKASQSKFKDSDRYYRGQILKMLIKNNKVSQNTLLDAFKDIPTINKKRLEKILQGMIRDSLIKQQGSNFLV